MLDVREFAYKMLEAAKETLQRERALTPVGFLFREDGIHAYDFDLSSKEAWRRSMKEFRRNARNQKVAAAILITDSGYRAFPPFANEKPMDKNPPQWLTEAIAKGCGRCICMDIDVRGQTPINVIVPYSATESGGIRFEKPEEGPIEFKGPAPPTSREEEGPTN